MAEQPQLDLFHIKYQKLDRRHASWMTRLRFWLGFSRVPCETATARIKAPCLKDAMAQLDTQLNQDRLHGWNTRGVQMLFGGEWISRRDATMRVYTDKPSLGLAR